jgi:hypothetical protein
VRYVLINRPPDAFVAFLLEDHHVIIIAFIDFKVKVEEYALGTITYFRYSFLTISHFHFLIIRTTVMVYYIRTFNYNSFETFLYVITNH